MDHTGSQGRTWRAQVDGFVWGEPYPVTIRVNKPNSREFESGSYYFRFATSNAGEAITKDGDADENHIGTTRQSEKSSRERLAELGVEIQFWRELDEKSRFGSGNFTNWVFRPLWRGGAALRGSFVDAKLVDRIAAFRLRLQSAAISENWIGGLGTGT